MGQKRGKSVRKGKIIIITRKRFMAGRKKWSSAFYVQFQNVVDWVIYYDGGGGGIYYTKLAVVVVDYPYLLLVSLIQALPILYSRLPPPIVDYPIYY